jgi:serine/threonine-protein kinase
VDALANLATSPADLVQDGDNILTDFQKRELRSITNESEFMSAKRKLVKGDCILRKNIGKGGCGSVFRAFWVEKREVVAVKVFELAHDNQAAQKQARNRFEREAKRLMQLSCAGLPQVFHFNLDNQQAYLVMQYIRGPNLHQHVSTNAPITTVEAERYLWQLAHVLRYLHEPYEVDGSNRFGVIHRDIKPHNVVAGDRGEVWLVDFGIARYSDAETLLTRGPVGTWEYASPEQFDDSHNVTPASDLYSLGCTLFFALTGKLPFGSSGYQEMRRRHLENARPHAMDANPAVPPWLDRVLFKLMAVELKYRYRSAEQLMSDLARVQLATDLIGEGNV